MAASRAVLETYELLESILHELSAFELGAPIQVCKTWRTVITNSKRIDYIVPLVPFTGNHMRHGLHSPHYDTPSTPKLHPGLKDQSRGDEVEIFWLGDHQSLEAIERIPQYDFITNLPVQAIQLNHGSQRCVLQRTAGIRVGQVSALIREAKTRDGCERVNGVVHRCRSGRGYLPWP